LARERWIDREHFPTGACSLEGKDGEERTPYIPQGVVTTFCHFL
jgi:hypothetical protein